MKCNLKDQNEAFNFAVSSFKDSFMVTNDMTKSLRYAISEVNNKYPDIDFEVSSLTDPIVSTMKNKGIIPDTYFFSENQRKKSVKKQTKSVDDKIKKVQEDIKNIENGTYVLKDKTKKEEKTEKEKELDSLRKKKKDLVYEYSGEKSKKEAESEQNRINKIVDKFNSFGLDKSKKDKAARKIYEKLTEEGYLTKDEILNIFAEAAGLPSMTEELRADIVKNAKDYRDVKRIDTELAKLEQDYSDKKKDKNNPITETERKQFLEKAAKLTEEHENAKDNLWKSTQKIDNQMMANDSFLHDIPSMVQMGIMSPISLIRNVTSAVFDSIPRAFIKSLAAVSTNIHEKIVLEKMLNRKDVKTSIPLGARFTGGIKGAPSTFKKVIKSFVIGRSDFGGGLQGANYLDSMESFRKAAKKEGVEKALKTFWAAIKIPADGVSRILGSSDLAFFDPVMQGELNRIAKQKGLDEVETILFMNNPDEASLKIATDEAKKVTLKDDGGEKMKGIVKLLTFDSRAKANAMIANGKNPLWANTVTAVASLLAKMTIPFVKTPINVWRLANRYLVPEYHLGKTIYNYVQGDTTTEERRKDLHEGVFQAAVGYHLRGVAMQMIAQGLISAGYSDDDKEMRDAVELKAGGSNRVNIDAFIRGLMFMDVAEKKTDSYINLNSMGLSGLVLGTYAHAFNGLSKEEKDAQLKLSSAFNPTVGLKTVLPSGAALLDNTFMSGLNQVMAAMREPDKKGQRLGMNYINLLLTSLYPTTFQKMSQVSSPEKKMTYDKDISFLDNLSNNLGYNYLYNSKDLKDKYFSLINDKDQDVTKKRDYFVFDNYAGRLVAEWFDPFKSTESNIGTPVDKLVTVAREDEGGNRGAYFPTQVKDVVSFENNETGDKYSAKLDKEQYKYYQQMAAMSRMLLITPILDDDIFKNASKENKRKMLSDKYVEGREMAKIALLEKYPSLYSEKNIKESNENDEYNLFKEKYPKQ